MPPIEVFYFQGVSFLLSDTADAAIYIFGQKKIRNILCQKLNCFGWRNTKKRSVRRHGTKQLVLSTDDDDDGNKHGVHGGFRYELDVIAGRSTINNDGVNTTKSTTGVIQTLECEMSTKV